MDLTIRDILIIAETSLIVTGILVFLLVLYRYIRRTKIERALLEEQLFKLQAETAAKIPPEVSERTLPQPEPPNELVQACISDECVLYAGAGLSAQAGFPTWKPFVRDLLKWAEKGNFIKKSFAESLRVGIEHEELDQVADSIISNIYAKDAKVQLNDYLRGIFSQDTSPSQAHKILKEISFSGAMTTNFDVLLEDTFADREGRVYIPQDTEFLLEALTKKDFFILQLYGTLERPESVLVAPMEYQQTIAGNRPFADFMQSLFFSKTILFLGSSLEGIDAFLKGITFPSSTPQRHYALVAVRGSAWEAAADGLLRRYGIRVLPYTPTDDHSELPVFLNELRRRVNAESERAATFHQKGQHSSRIKSIRLINIGPFKNLELQFDRNWNILLGDNGVGKSRILKAIALAICGKEAEQYADRLLRANQSSGEIWIETDRGKSYRTEIYRTSRGAEVKSVPTRLLEAEGWLAIGFPPLRSLTWARPKGPEATHVRSRPTADDMLPLIKDEPDPRFDELKQWLVNLDYERSKGAKDSGTAERLIHKFFEIIDHLTEGLKIEFKEVKSDTFEVTVITDDGAVPIEAISQGTTSLIGWTGVLLQRFYRVYGDDKEPASRYGLVLIDEIDAHMHPAWQQKLVSYINEIFPNMQFIATTHSPLIVGGMPTEQVIRLKRNDEGVIEKVDLPADMTMGRADQVLTGSLFELDTTLDITTQEKIKLYQKLLGKSNRTEEEEEEFQRLRQVLGFRIPVSQENIAERRAQELLSALLEEQVGEMYPAVKEKILERAEQLLDEVQSKRCEES